MVRSRSWSEIVEHFRDRKPAMAEFVEWIRNSKYSDGLFALTSLDTLVIGQSPEFEFWNGVIRVNEDGGIFRLTFVESESSSSKGEFDRLELIPAFEKLIESLHWFSNSENEE